MIRTWLTTYKKKTVRLDELQTACSGMSYDMFWEEIRQLEDEDVLLPIQASGKDFNGLARKYTIAAGALYRKQAAKIQQEAVHFGISGCIDLSRYYRQPPDIWERDREYIRKLSDFLSQPSQKPVSLQQRSYDIFGDEKFLLHADSLLKRINLTKEMLAVIDEPDPLMMAVQSESSRHTCFHLIVENKAPWHGLLPHLSQTPLTSLILGYGWKILGNIHLLPAQCGCPHAHHIIWYAGDFDWEGLRIWHELTRQAACHSDTAQIEIRPALPFYHAFLRHKPSTGKTNQEESPEALTDLLRQMSTADANTLKTILSDGQYYPQEALSSEELVACTKELTDSWN